LTEDPRSHSQEHSLEVQLPFLQQLKPGFTFVPVAIGAAGLDTLEALGEALAQVLSRTKPPGLIVASSDMNHYDDDRSTPAEDKQAIEYIWKLDARGVYQVLRSKNISMCGYGPAVAMLTAARELGAQHAELIRYATSGDTSGDRERVVGYAGI